MTIEVQVRGGNVVKAMRILKKKLEKDGLMQEIRRRQYYEKPSEKKLRVKKQNIARVKKRERERLAKDDF
jgi:small subunit ribosomal protein S21